MPFLKVQHAAAVSLLMWSGAAATRASAQASVGWAVPPLDAAAATRVATATERPRYRPSDVRVFVSVADRRLWVVARADTLRTAVVSVASGRELAYAGRRWRFATPRGSLRVLAKRTDPVWMPPDWHYAEVASTHGLGLRALPRGGVRLTTGARLVIRDSIVGLTEPGVSTFLPLPVDEHIVFDSTLFIPPVGTRNRHLAGELGKYALDLGNGYLLHGTPVQESVGRETTHGCIRLTDEDLAWIYENVPVGAVVVVR